MSDVEVSSVIAAAVWDRIASIEGATVTAD